MKATRADEALELVRQAAFAARQTGELPDFLAGIERVCVEVLLSQPTAAETVAQMETGDRLLSTAEAATVLGRSAWWVRQNKAALPMVRLPTGGYGFSASGLERWLKRRSS